MAKYKSGDIVKLKSGGPDMTVQNYAATVANQESKRVQCKWFVGTKVEGDTFHEDSLVTIPTDGDKK